MRKQKMWNAVFDKKPEAIVVKQTEEAVVVAMGLARKMNYTSQLAVFVKYWKWLISVLINFKCF